MACTHGQHDNIRVHIRAYNDIRDWHVCVCVCMKKFDVLLIIQYHTIYTRTFHIISKYIIIRMLIYYYQD